MFVRFTAAVVNSRFINTFKLTIKKTCRKEKKSRGASNIFQASYLFIQVFIQQRPAGIVRVSWSSSFRSEKKISFHAGELQNSQIRENMHQKRLQNPVVRRIPVDCRSRRYEGTSGRTISMFPILSVWTQTNSGRVMKESIRLPFFWGGTTGFCRAVQKMIGSFKAMQPEKDSFG